MKHSRVVLLALQMHRIEQARCERNGADHQHPSADGLPCPDINELEYANNH